MKKAKPDVTIALPAFNEQKNIKKLLESLLSQEIKSANLEQILIIDDGSTDNTREQAREVKSEKIQVVYDGKNKGKSARLNEIFERVESDILVLIDADVLSQDSTCIENLLHKLLETRSTLASGNPQKSVGTSRMDRIMSVSALLQEHIKQNLRDGDNVYACHGRLIALTKQIYKHIKVPAEAVGNDAFIYFTNKVRDGKFTYVPDAKVTYKMPQTAADYSKQRDRFNRSKIMHKKNFANELDIDSEYRIPVGVLLMSASPIVFRMPVKTIAYLIILVTSKLRKNNTLSRGWAISETTK